MVSTQLQIASEPATETALRTGEMVSAYRVERLLGSGGMGWVYSATSVLDQRVVALKVLRGDQLRLDRAIDRMMREAAILATIGHDGVPQFFECGLLADGRPWIAMELVEGNSLQSKLTGPLGHDDVIELVANIADVLAAAHKRGVTHRDLKPDNILLTPGCPKFGLRVIDWGIAHHFAGVRYTNLNEAIGTPTYMAPEQARGGEPDGYCDVYGLGIVAYQALTGRAPFVGSTPVEILVQHMNRPVPSLAPRCPDAPFGLIDLIERMLAKTPCDRPTADDVQTTLRRLHADAAAPTYSFYSVDGADDGTAPIPRQIVDGNLTPATTLIRVAHSSNED